MVIDNAQAITNTKNALEAKGAAESVTIGKDSLPARKVQATEGIYYWVEKNNKLFKFFQDQNASELPNMLTTLQIT